MTIDKAKTYFWLLLDVFLAVFIISLIFVGIPALDNFSKSLSAARTITLSAEGKVIVVPDTAVISFSVISEGNNPESLVEDNNQKISSVIQFVKSKGIDSKDIKTINYNLYPKYENDEKTNRSFISGYNLTQTINLKIRDLKKVAEIIGGLTPLGINKIEGPIFIVDDPEKFLREARADAFSKIKNKAEEISLETGVKFGQIINIYEYPSSPIGPVFYKNMESQLGGIGGFSRPPLPTIEPGSEELKVQLNIVYALK